MNLTRGALELWPGAPPTPAWHLATNGVGLTIADLGAHLCDVTVPQGDESITITIGYPALPGGPEGFHGASVGRYANRIADAAFELDGIRHDLDANEQGNQLHGGPLGFDKHVWSGDAEVAGDTISARLSHQSPDGDQGFPGAVSASVLFELCDAELTIEYSAETDRATPINLTNHVYWNLAGGGSLDGHDLTVRAGRFVDVDDASIPLPGPPRSVVDTRFDCRAPRSLAAVVDDRGYDHCFLLDPDRTAPSAVLAHESGRRVDVWTDQVGLQVYTGQHLSPAVRGIALETQSLPDTPNRPDFGDATVRPGDTYRSLTRFSFAW